MAKSLQENSGITNSEQLPDLRSLREARGLTLDDVSQVTKISLKNLEAMEKGDFQYLPPPVYTRAYIKSYAKLLGLDESQLLSRYEKNIAVFVPDVEDNATDVPERASYFSKKIILNSSLVLVLCALGFFAYSYLSSQVGNVAPENFLPKTAADKPLTEVKKSDVSAQPVSGVNSEVARETDKQQLPQTGTPKATIPVKPQEKGEEAKTPAIKTPSVQPVILVITAREKTWLRITEDQKKTYQLLMQPGERIERSASQYDLFIGNAGGIVVQHQGNTLQSLGKSGEVVHLHLP